MFKRLLICAMGLAPILGAAIILEVSEGAGPGDPPPPVPTSITSIPFSLTVVPGNAVPANSCEDGGVLNRNCWYQNDTGQDLIGLAFVFEYIGDITCTGDVFLGCGIDTQGTTRTVTFQGGNIPSGDDFYLILSGVPEGTTVTLAEIPEPATWSVVMIGLAGCVALARRRRLT